MLSGPKRLVVAGFIVGLITAATVTVVTAQWPTTCVEANDAFEQYVGNYHNVGIYQRTFGDPYAAEQACRNDHLDDTRAAFAWALGQTPQQPGDVAQFKGQPPTAPQRIEFGDCAGFDHKWPRLHAQYCRLAGAEAGYDRVVWIDNLPPSDGGGLALQGFRWSLTGPVSKSGTELSDGDSRKVFLHDLPLGSYSYTVKAFNAAGESLPASLDFVLDTLPEEIPQPGYWNPRLLEVAQYLKRALSIFTNAIDPMIQEGLRAIFGTVGGTRFAAYSPRAHLIVIDSQYQHSRLQGLAPTLAHELFHALNLGPGRGSVTTTEGCYQEEISAMRVQAAIWQGMGPPAPQSRIEQITDNIYQHHRAGTLEAAVRAAYQEQCSRYPG